MKKKRYTKNTAETNKMEKMLKNMMDKYHKKNVSRGNKRDEKYCHKQCKHFDQTYCLRFLDGKKGNCFY